MPLFHVGGLSILVRSVIGGVPATVHEKFDPVRVSQAIDEGATLISLVPTMLQRLLDERTRPFPSSLRTVLLGGGPAPRALLDRAIHAGVPIAPTYGLTESSSQAVTLLPSETPDHLGTAGRPLFFTELRTSGAEGEPGEILLRGPTVFQGYWENPAATADALRDGWLHTGDMGIIDQDGYLTVLDRRHDLIISGGENVYPAEVESVLMEHPAVSEAGVFGVEDPDWGEVPAAVIVPKGPAPSAEDLSSFLRARLAPYKVPRFFHVVDELPRNAAGKLMRHRLAEIVKENRA